MPNKLTAFSNNFENLSVPYAETLDKLLDFITIDLIQQDIRLSPADTLARSMTEHILKTPDENHSEKIEIIISDRASGIEMSRVEVSGSYLRGLFEAKKRAYMAAYCRTESKKIAHIAA